MTTMHTIGCIIISIAFVLSLFTIIDMVKGNNKIWILPILIVVGIFLILCATQKPILDRYYQVENPSSYRELFPETYDEGYNAGFKDGVSSINKTSYEAGHNTGYKEGYEKAIKDAVLIEVTDNRYIISFNGEDNIYVYNK